MCTWVWNWCFPKARPMLVESVVMELSDPVANTERFLGEGAFGKVYEVVWEGRCYAAKVIPASKITTNEVDILRAVGQHPNIVSYVNHATFMDGTVHLYMEHGGVCVYDILEKSKIPHPMTQSWFSHLVHALEHLHENRIAHRDVKLENLVVDGTGTLRLVDFGLAYMYTRDEFPVSLTQRVGSHLYMAPEIILLNAWSGYACDVWAAGVVLHLMLTSTFPIVTYPPSTAFWDALLLQDKGLSPVESYRNVFGLETPSSAHDALDACLAIRRRRDIAFISRLAYVRNLPSNNDNVSIEELKLHARP